MCGRGSKGYPIPYSAPSCPGMELPSSSPRWLSEIKHLNRQKTDVLFWSPLRSSGISSPNHLLWKKILASTSEKVENSTSFPFDGQNNPHQICKVLVGIISRKYIDDKPGLLLAVRSFFPITVHASERIHSFSTMKALLVEELDPRERLRGDHVSVPRHGGGKRYGSGYTGRTSELCLFSPS